MGFRVAVQMRGNSMGQAQRSGGRNISQSRAEEQRTKYIAERRRKQGNTGKRTGNTYKNSARDSISVISGSNSPNREGGGAQRSVKSGRENARRRGTGNDGLENLELWEISRKSDNPRLMRLADREQVPCAKRPSRPSPICGQSTAGQLYQPTQGKAPESLFIPDYGFFNDRCGPDPDLSDDRGCFSHDAS